MAAAGILIFVHISQRARFQSYLDMLNKPGRVSLEVLALYSVKPTREAVKALCAQLRGELNDVEMLHRLKPNNSLRDLTAKWRMTTRFTSEFDLIVGLETVREEFRRKYPHPNLTLQAGKVEPGESLIEAAVRELREEARINVANVCGPPVGLMGKGMAMFTVYVMPETQLHMGEDDMLYIS